MAVRLDRIAVMPILSPLSCLARLRPLARDSISPARRIIRRNIPGNVSDTFQVTPKLTLNLGLRYDLFSPLQPRNSAGNFIYDLPSNMLLPINQGFVNSRGNVRWDTNNWAPRFGFAYRFDDKTVVRGGYGISYWNGMVQLGANQFINVNSGVVNGTAGTYGVAGSFNQIPFPQRCRGPTVASNFPYYFTSRNVETPYVQSFNFMVQRDLGWATVLDASYVGSLGRQLPFIQNLNAAAPGTGAAGFLLTLPLMKLRLRRCISKEPGRRATITHFSLT